MLFEAAVSLPNAVAASAWIPFAVALVFSLLFSALYVKYFWNTHESDRCSAVIATLGLCIALLVSFLLPVDVFLVSYMKNENGTFKDWATNNTRIAVENSVLYSYYVLYSVIVLFTFLLLPLVYFAYEEKDEERNNTAARFCTAAKYTSVLILFAVSLLLMGAFIPFRDSMPKNSTQWERIEYLINEVYSNRGQDAIIFILNIMTVIGMLIVILYTGVGLSAFPVGLLRGSRKIEAEQTYVDQRDNEVKSQISALRNQERYKKLTTSDSASLTELEEEQHLLSRMKRELQQAKKGILYKVQPFCYLIDSLFGIIGILFGFLLWVSLCIANIDKLMHSFGYELAYFLKEPYFLNPFDYIMVLAQKVFPLDYILYFGIVVFLVLCTISGIRYLGIWCLCVRMYRIRAHRTQPQGLIMLCAILMYGVLALNVLLHAAVPQYTSYGSQHYVNSTEQHGEIKPCSADAPSGECILTTASFLMFKFAFKAWIFGAIFYWATWAFLLASIMGFFVTIIRSKQSFLKEAVDKDDFDESDDDIMVA